MTLEEQNVENIDKEIKAIREGLNIVYEEMNKLKNRYLRSMDAIARDIQKLEQRLEQNDRKEWRY